MAKRRKKCFRFAAPSLWLEHQLRNGGVGMKLVIKPFHSLPCQLEVFTINGKNADKDDFGDMYDHDAESAEPYSCADMQFDPKPPTEEVLDKYNLTEEEYYNICN